MHSRKRCKDHLGSQEYFGARRWRLQDLEGSDGRLGHEGKLGGGWGGGHRRSQDLSRRRFERFGWRQNDGTKELWRGNIEGNDEEEKRV